jgi:hypothetical protein
LREACEPGKLKEANRAGTAILGLADRGFYRGSLLSRFFEIYCVTSFFHWLFTPVWKMHSGAGTAILGLPDRGVDRGIFFFDIFLNLFHYRFFTWFSGRFGKCT